jgi:hypothetical protein
MCPTIYKYYSFQGKLKFTKISLRLNVIAIIQ